jgi:glycosyltransferase involved in cell wall biosynthesis
VNNIVSSTPGSCNLRFSKNKVRFINQGINEHDFPYSKRNQIKSGKILYYGRLDKSKNIHQVCRLARELNKQGANITVKIFGRPSNNRSDSYLASLLETNKDLIQRGIIQFKSAIPRKDIPGITKGFEFFLNLFDGSLDKTLIETTMLGLPVITWNREYCEQFGTWSGMPPMVDLKFIHNEITALKGSTSLIIDNEINRRLKIAIGQHNLDGWINRLVDVLKNHTNSS